MALHRPPNSPSNSRRHQPRFLRPPSHRRCDSPHRRASPAQAIHLFARVSGVGNPSSVEETEQLRRSVAMLAPRHPAAVDRELALDILSELQRLQRRERHLSEAIRRARKVLDESGEDDRASR